MTGTEATRHLRNCFSARPGESQRRPATNPGLQILKDRQELIDSPESLCSIFETCLVEMVISIGNQSMKRTSLFFCVAAMGLSAIAAPVLGADKLTVAFADAKWNGKRIPDGQHCEKFGGKGATPALKVSGIPKGTGAIRVEINDASYRPLSYDGGHGVVGFKYSGNGEVVLPPVAGGTNKTPKGTWI